MYKRFEPLVTTSFLLAALICACSSAQAREKVLYQFPGGSGGNDPQAGLVFDAQGNAYGTTYYGGTYGWGTVFRLTPSHDGWTQQLLYSFLGGSDGYNPAGTLAIDATGNLYGTTSYGGTGTGCQQRSCGTVFELALSNGNWKHVVLHSFCSPTGCNDGSIPSGLTFDQAGNLYGTTAGGGQYGSGTIYELYRSQGSWKEKILHAFNNNGDGIDPNPGLTMDKSGNLYGTTCCGGGYGYGVVFVLKPSKRKWKEVLIFAFDGTSNNSAYPNGYLALDSAGNILGTTPGDYNGCPSNCGMVFKLARSNGQWVESAVYTFDGTHGARPNFGLIPDGAGNFYGSTVSGGKNNFGEIFALKPGKTWTIQALYSFTGDGGDESPNPGLTFGPDGGLYGTNPAVYSGQYDGQVFEVLR
jgi:uncharacterized repeat protein (TIGR03803 family)